MKKKEPFLPPEIRFNMELELENNVLMGASQNVDESVLSTGHSVDYYDYSEEDNWE